MSAARDAPYDLVLAGGGLANGLVALAVRAARPDAAIAVVEAGPSFGGDHTWSFHESDLGPPGDPRRAVVEPIVAHRWPGYAVRFAGRDGRAGYERRLGLPYASATSARLHAAVAAAAGSGARLNARIASLDPDGLTLEGGERVAGPVLDGRGARPTAALSLGWQKFVGVEVRTLAPHGLAEPVVMDATVEQLDGYRFVYLLPFAPDRLLIEDTYYSATPDLDRGALRARALAYAAARGWEVAAVEREEAGVLPITLAGDPAAFAAEGAPGVAASGLRAGLFHPTTGYSLPEAARLAMAVAALPAVTPTALLTASRTLAAERWAAHAPFRLLNRMLFGAGAPADRHGVLARFYRFPEDAVARFYAGELTLADRLRLVAGKPPVPVLPALACVSEARWLARGRRPT